MGSFGNSFVGVLSTIMNKASEGCFNFFKVCSIYSPRAFNYSPNFLCRQKSKQPLPLFRYTSTILHMIIPHFNDTYEITI